MTRQPRRLYLDTAVLLDIGDGRVPAHEAATLVSEMVESQTMLVVSREHVQDVSRGIASAVESFVVAVESFQPVLLVTDGPDAVEPLTAERADIGVTPCMNFRELVYSEAARPWLDKMNATYEQVHAGPVEAQRVSSSVAAPPLRSSGEHLSEEDAAGLVAMLLAFHNQAVVKVPTPSRPSLKAVGHGKSH